MKTSAPKEHLVKIAHRSAAVQMMLLAVQKQDNAFVRLAGKVTVATGLVTQRRGEKIARNNVIVSTMVHVIHKQVRVLAALDGQEIFATRNVNSDTLGIIARLTAIVISTIPLLVMPLMEDVNARHHGLVSRLY